MTFATDGGDVHAVRGVTLDVRRGEVLAIVGESGSGKTVTARTILGLLPETARMGGRSCSTAPNVVGLDEEGAARGARHQGRHDLPGAVHGAQPGLHGGLAARRGPARARQVHARPRRAPSAIEMLRRVGIPDPARRVDDYPHQFSGGQKQRIVIAMALALDPTVIVADEPTTALDVTVQAEILDLLRELRDEDGTAIVLITHNMGVVADLADRVAVMLDGEIVETAPRRASCSPPRSTSTPSGCSPRCRGSRSPTGSCPIARPAARAGRRRATICDRVPGPVRSAGVPRRRPRRASRSRPARCSGLVGESGSGKTTIGRAIAGLTPVAGGSLRVLGTEMLGVQERDFRPRRKELGFVFQDPATSFNPLLTIAQKRRRAADRAHGVAETPRPRRAEGRRAARGGAAAQGVRRPVPARALAAVSVSAPRSRAPSRSTRSC